MRLMAVVALLASLGAAPARAGLDLNWNACASPPGASDLTMSCAEGDIAQLFATFKTPTVVSGFVALDAVLDVAFAGTEIPPFWHFEVGGCNEGFLAISDARPLTSCPSASFQTPWGAGGTQADAFITAYAPGFGNSTRARMLVTVARSSSSPVTLNTANNYYAFDLSLFSDQVGFCSGCTTPAEIYWTSAALYSVPASVPAVIVTGPGTRSDFVSVNGGLSDVRLFSLAPPTVHRDDQASISVTGARLQALTELRLVAAGLPDLVATGIQASADGRTLSGTVDFTDAASSFRDAVVSNPGGDTDSLHSALQVLGGPVIYSVSPQVAENVGSITLEVVGNGFDPAAEVRMRRSGHTDIMGSNVIVTLQGQRLTTVFDMSLFAAGLWDLFIRNPDGETASKIGALDVRLVSQAPLVTSVIPSVAADTGSIRLRAVGDRFQPGSSLSLRRPGEADIVGTGVVVSPGGTQVSADFSLSGRARGLWSVVVVGPDSLVGTLLNGFRIDVVPRLTQVSPVSGLVNIAEIMVTVTGRDIVPGAQMRLVGPGGLLHGLDNTVAADSGSMVARFVTFGVQPGVRDVEVINPSGLTGRLTAAFELRAGPLLTGIFPAVAPDTGSATVTMTMTGVAPGVDVRLQRPGQTDIVGTNVTLSAAHDTLRARFDLAMREPGGWTVRLANPDGTYGEFPQAFTVVVSPRPQSVSPDSAGDGGPAMITVTGTGFSFATASLRHVATGQVLNPTPSTPTSDSSSVQATFQLLDAPLGSYDVLVTNSNGVSGVLPAAFRVFGSLRLFSVTPSAAPDTGIAMLTMRVGRVVPGVDVRLTRPGDADIVGTDVTLSAAQDTLRARFDLSLRTPGAWSVRLSNPNGVFGVFQQVFTILRTPRPQSVTPDSAGDGGFATLVIDGSGFENPAASLRHVATGAVLNATSTTIVAFRVNATFNLLDAPPGPYDVRVTNGNGLTGTLPAAFRVTAGLQLIAVLPQAAETNTQATLVVTGRGIMPGATVAMGVSGFGFPLSGTNVAVDPSGQSVTATFNLSGQLPGLRDLSVRNPDGNARVLASRFRVLSLPQVTALSPSQVSTPAPIAVTITGRVFLPGATARLVRSGTPDIPGQNVIVMPDSQHIQCTFDLTGQAYGFWDVVVTNPSGNSGGKANGMLLYIPPQTFEQGLDLTWGGCNLADPDDAENVDIECGNPDFTATLVGNFQPPVAFKDLSALDAVFTIDFKASQVPPFWFAQTGGCNQDLLSVSALRPSNCPAPTVSPWGTAFEAFITAYAYGSQIGFPPDRARMLLTIVRSSPFQLEGGTNYLGFTLTLSNANPNGCPGCETQADINWGSAVLYSSSEVQSPMTLTGPGLRRANVTVNVQQRPPFFASSITPSTLPKQNNLAVTILALGLETGATAQLVRSGETSIPMRDIVTTADGETLRAVVDLASAALGTWGLEVRNPGGETSLVLDAIQVELDTAGNPTALVLSPNGDERLLVNSDFDVRWESNDDIGVSSVDLFLSRSGPSGPFDPVATGLPPSGTYRWRAVRPLSDYCYFRAVARDASGRSGSDTSDYPFAIADFPTPTQMLRFDAEARDEGIELRWAFATPSAFTSVAVQRAEGVSGAWQDLGLQPISDGDVMSALDALVVPGRSYQYRLRAMTPAGATQMFGPITATAAGDAGKPLAIAVSPNPSRGPVDVAFSLARPGTARISIVDLMGREVAASTVAARTAGAQHWAWNGAIGLGPAPAGVYFVRIETAERAWVRRFVLAR